MGRVIGAAVVAAVILFIWGFIAWAATGIYDFAMHNLPDEDAVAEVLTAQNIDTGTYFLPGMPDTSGLAAEEADRLNEDWNARHRSGPVAMILYRRQGLEPMHWTAFVRGFAIYFLAALVMAMLLRWARIRSFGGRLSFVFFGAFFAVIATHGVIWNFMHTPDTYAFVMMIDPLIGWLLAGIALAAMVTPRAGGPTAPRMPE